MNDLVSVGSHGKRVNAKSRPAFLETAIAGVEEAYEHPSLVVETDGIDQQFYIEKNEIWIAGSNDYLDWKANAKGGLADWYGIKARLGFVKIMQKLRAAILKMTDPMKTVMIYGHSLGGAIATLMGRWLYSRDKTCAVITWGMPHVTPYKIDVPMPAAYHYHAQGDVVPHLTRRASFCYGFPWVKPWWPRMDGYRYLTKAVTTKAAEVAGLATAFTSFNILKLIRKFKYYHSGEHYRSFLCTDQKQKA